MEAKKILVIGSLNIDMVVHADHTPRTGETILAGEMTMVPGGKGANQACAAGRLGANVTMFGAVGRDDYAALQQKSLSDSGVDVSHLVVKDGISTGIAFITVDKNGDNSIVVVSGSNMALDVRDIEEHIDLIKEADVVIFQLEIPLETVLYAAKRAKELGKTVILDPAPAPNEFPEELYRYIDVIKPNENEAARLTGVEECEKNFEEAAAVLRSRGVRNVLITLGEKGVYLDSETCGRVRIPARKVQAVDTTAAGDAFTAALAMMLTRGSNIKEAAEFASLVSSVVVTRQGAQTSIPSFEEVEEIAKQS